MTTTKPAAKQVSARGMAWFQQARFGMFVHWGVYSLLERGEWVMHLDRVPLAEYEALPQRFNPVKFNAEEWVRIAADAGQKYIVITSRHHDGFSMYDTALSEYKVTNTPFKRDPLAELANACARHSGVKLGFYSSLLDWHHPAYRFRAESGLAWSDYVGFLHGQVRELCTQFGEIMCLWFDGDWPLATFSEKDGNMHFLPGGSFEYDALYDVIHTLQPDAIVHNNHHVAPIPGEDVQGFEQDLPGENSAGFNATQPTDMPIEVCMTQNNSWGYHAGDHDHKSTRTLIEKLVKSASLGANYLLNVGPTPQGEILPVHAERSRGMGAWLARNGESVYGAGKGVFVSGRIRQELVTNAGAFEQSVDAVSTRRGETHYVHLLRHTSDVVVLKDLSGMVNLDALRVTLLSDGTSVEACVRNGMLEVIVPEQRRDVLNTVLCLAPG
jgi:alpha-L-fucosidase